MAFEPGQQQRQHLQYGQQPACVGISSREEAEDGLWRKSERQVSRFCSELRFACYCSSCLRQRGFMHRRDSLTICDQASNTTRCFVAIAHIIPLMSLQLPAKGVAPAPPSSSSSSSLSASQPGITTSTRNKLASADATSSTGNQRTSVYGSKQRAVLRNSTTGIPNPFIVSPKRRPNATNTQPGTSGSSSSNSSSHARKNATVDAIDDIYDTRTLEDMIDHSTALLANQYVHNWLIVINISFSSES